MRNKQIRYIPCERCGIPTIIGICSKCEKEMAREENYEQEIEEYGDNDEYS